MCDEAGEIHLGAAPVPETVGIVLHAETVYIEGAEDCETGADVVCFSHGRDLYSWLIRGGYTPGYHGSWRRMI